MRKKITNYSLLALALVTATIAISSDAIGQEPAEGPVTAGPPAWVLDAWQSGDRPAQPMGPPAWVLDRQEMAKELGLLGPPADVLEAWQNGEGFSLPGPPEFVFELFGFWTLVS